MNTWVNNTGRVVARTMRRQYHRVRGARSAVSAEFGQCTNHLI